MSWASTAPADAPRPSATLSVEEERALLHVLNVTGDLRPASSAAVGAVQAAVGHARVLGAPNAEPKKKRKHTTPTRDREAKELRALRLEAVALNARLKGLQSAAVGGSGGASKRQRIWRHVARRQLALRRQAESERARLVHELHAHLETARAMQTLWTQSLMPREDRGGADTAAREAGDAGGVRRILQERGRNVLDRLASRLDAAYALVDAVLPQSAPSTCDLSRLLSTSAGSWLAANHDHVEPIELRDERVLPFRFERVVDAMWKTWVRWHVGGASSSAGMSSAYCVHACVDRPENTFAVKFRLKCSPHASALGDEYLDETLVVRRYLEADRLVLVWRGTSGGDGVDGVLTDDTGWVVVEQGRCELCPGRFDLGEEGGDGGAGRSECGCYGRTAMRSYVRMTPMTSSRVGEHSRSIENPTGTITAARVTRLARIAAELYRQDVEFIHREMETLLIRDARRRH